MDDRSYGIGYVSRIGGTNVGADRRREAVVSDVSVGERKKHQVGHSALGGMERIRSF